MPQTCSCLSRRPSSAAHAPTLDGPGAVQTIKRALEADAPNGAVVEFTEGSGQTGWHARRWRPGLEKAVALASEEAFGKPAAYMGEGGTIPFMGMLGEKFPNTQLSSRSVGPHSNAMAPTNSCTFRRPARDLGGGAPGRGAPRRPAG